MPSGPTLSPQALAGLLPEADLENIDSIYGDLTVQLSFDRGTPTRIAIEQAYGIAQRRMLIAGLCIMSLTLVWITLIKNYNVAKMQQTKGRLF